MIILVSDGFSFDLEILWLAQRWDLEIAEVPVHWVDAPGSKVDPARESVKFLIDVAVLRYRGWRGRYAATYPTVLAAIGQGSDQIRVALVTAYPPSQTTLNEYGYHLARHLAPKREVAEHLVARHFADQGDAILAKI